MFKHTSNGEEPPVAQSPRQVAPPSISRVRLSILPPSSLSPKLQYPMEFSPLNLVNSEQTSRFPYLLWNIHKTKTFRNFLNNVTLRKLWVWHSEGRASWNILIIEANKMHYFSTLFWYTTVHVSNRPTVHHQESWYSICHTIYVDCLLVDSQHK